MDTPAGTPKKGVDDRLGELYARVIPCGRESVSVRVGAEEAGRGHRWVHMDASVLEKLQAARAAGRAAAADSVPSEVHPGLLIGAAGAAADMEQLVARGVTRVLAVGSGLAAPQGQHEGVRYLCVGVSDDAEAAGRLEGLLEEALDFIDAGLACGEAVLVHCFAGVSRSVTVAAAWLLLRSGRSECATAEAALATIRHVRPRARPNAGFVEMLRKLEAKRQGQGGESGS